MLGLDVLYDPDADDHLIRYTSRRESRLVLTKDRRLAAILGSDAYLVYGSKVAEEFTSLVPLLRHLACRFDPLSRCMDCNEKLTSMKHAEAEGNVPRYVFASCRDFMRCPKCGKIYWEGTHSGSMRKGIELMLEEARGP